MPDAGGRPRPGRDALCAERLRIALEPMHVRVYARLRSTQQKAIEELEAGRLAPPALIVATQQTAGRGQRANRWWSDAGSLCATFLFPEKGVSNGKGVSPLFLINCPDVKIQRLTPFCGTVPLRAGLAVAEVVAGALPRARVQVKWPNDVLVNGRKIAGVLCERRRGCDIIGVGLNVRTHLARSPHEVRHTATSLHRHCSRPPARESLLIELARALAYELYRPNFIASYTRRHAWRGKRLRVQTDAGPVEGRCCGIDEEGCLLVQTANGAVRVTDSTRVSTVSPSAPIGRRG